MIDIIKQQFQLYDSVESKIHKTREFLQILCLKILYDKDYFKNLAFVGGTALRILFGLRRYSEDLDFSLVRKEGYYFPELCRQLQKGLSLFGLKTDAKTNAKNNVQSSLLKFTGIMKHLSLSQLPEQKLSIKIEIDSRPPKGWRIENTIINKTYLFTISHFDLPSLYATKIHACFFRGFTKGRDFYDFAWYLANKVQPNYALLNNAIRQTQKKDYLINKHNFKEFLLESISQVDFTYVRSDVERFLEDKNELKLLETKTIARNIELTYS